MAATAVIPAATTSVGSAGLGTPRTVRAGVLDVAYFETGRSGQQAALGADVVAANADGAA
ncbi:hypothetical protein SMIR_03005 [Streptomyces mirabilis]|uniref:hypothetical protein n=1 Tax=Streptomyces mirabilis TaxID=68239 RepID=UPI001BAF51C9|nr:hypothetical protein [Streptomyces mirabilis]QUW78240.1 hypothetical protein SMIR_03005 [Streptomyces mirabilis]